MTYFISDKNGTEEEQL